ncbi:GDYXXLXY domain-containing protein [Paenibacillus aestuarii]|uniref:GDYXXLXY domain-containing protein n=1 Tax=Paenibacillus aestuarii TaxID=516965 RepID=A0ABW0K5N0_9BACL|nr:GDYXXLXY domain-containing protein [Paenibacillus aestuarii]
MKSKFVTVQLGYVLGVSSLLTAIVYFFATNWEALSRAERFVPIFVLILGFYGLSVWLSRNSERAFLSRLSLFASCVSFGVGVALIGQTYNSHADSYSLYAIWFIPALLFSLLTRWQPFYVLAYVLGHLAYSFYFFPKWWGRPEAEAAEIVILLVLAVINGLIYALTERGRLQSGFLKWVSFQVAILLMLWTSNSIVFEHFGGWMNILLLAVLAGVIRYVHRTRSKTYLLFAGLWVSIAMTMKYIELAVHYYSIWFYIGGVLFVILFVGANVKFVHYVRTWNPAAAPAAVEPAEAPAKQEGEFAKWMARVLTVAVIVIGTLIGSLSLVGLVTTFTDFHNPEYFLIGFGLLAVVTMIWLSKINNLVRYTLLSCGLLLGAGTAAVESDTVMLALFLLLTILAFIRIDGLVQRILFVLAGEVMATVLLGQWLDQTVPVFTVLTIVLFVIFLLANLIRREPVRSPLLYSSFPSFLLSFFILTFITENAWYYAVNALFFITVIAVLVIGRQLQTSWIYDWGLAFWTAFLVYKYYDLAWKLLHKSISFAILGILILAITVWYEKRNRQDIAGFTEASDVYRGSRLLIAVLVLLQLAAMGLQIGKSEWLLAHGKLIKLELAPLDPRSMLQGDYVRLRYTISSPELQEGWEDSSIFHKKISVVLSPNPSTGIYEYRRLFMPGERLGSDEVRLNGTISGYENIEYGIETYFVPEGTGHDVERMAKYAEVKVSAGGDAILVRLLQYPDIVR